MRRYYIADIAQPETAVLQRAVKGRQSAGVICVNQKIPFFAPHQKSIRISIAQGQNIRFHPARSSGGEERAIIFLPDGTYEWGVQTVNAAYDGSPFTAGPDFTVTSTSDIQSVSASQEASSTDGVQFYSPSGMQLSQPRHGVNIIRSRQGVSKVMRP